MRVFDIHLAEMTFIIDVKEPVESSGTVVKKYAQMTLLFLYISLV
jgi:hypothetical protein